VWGKHFPHALRVTVRSESDERQRGKAPWRARRMPSEGASPVAPTKFVNSL